MRQHSFRTPRTADKIRLAVVGANLTSIFPLNAVVTPDRRLAHRRAKGSFSRPSLAKATKTFNALVIEGLDPWANRAK